ncbi:signal peptidase I [Caldicellulosiruptor owensensis OL]|uniref:Signal peptidase I n=1 Tax=Caldicellulosiruptor owensensis (strain ATCC 700167 / DSM 13100 / OL) TaxID=632518 RepID=E4Q2J5_CALOW|nr:signal peptidase I [Caldicellulosiruptor owensensis]ADQ04937.1 signal peptidase I [Caldicellulosiruptor owensensis OL]
MMEQHQTLKLQNKVVKEAVEWILWIGGAVLIALILRTYVFSLVIVPTGSMLNTIQLNDRLFVYKLGYVLHIEDVKRGDIVVFKYPDDRKTLYVKRVIGLPGDTIEIKDGVLYINGRVYKENYLKEPMLGSFGPYKVPPGHYFMMGDNRNDSHDSRFWEHKYVSRDDIIGKVVFRVWPLSRAGVVK